MGAKDSRSQLLVKVAMFLYVAYGGLCGVVEISKACEILVKLELDLEMFIQPIHVAKES
jgi:hypothetical protein